MPLHSYRCFECDPKLKGESIQLFRHVTEKEVVPVCQLCSKPMQQDFNHPVSDGTIFRPITLEHVGPVPVTFNSRKELVDYARKNNLELGALL
jgi:hypothetical protein